MASLLVSKGVYVFFYGETTGTAGLLDVNTGSGRVEQGSPGVDLRFRREREVRRAPKESVRGSF